MPRALLPRLGARHRVGPGPPGVDPASPRAQFQLAAVERLALPFRVVRMVEIRARGDLVRGFQETHVVDPELGALPTAAHPALQLSTATPEVEGAARAVDRLAGDGRIERGFVRVDH